MYKLVILIESTAGPAFDATWPQFLHWAERMPGLRREATSRVHNLLYGGHEVALIHELFFDSHADLQRGLASPAGQQAGSLLQSMTGGRLALLVADHSEDDLSNIRKYQSPEPDETSPDAD
jgi:hypothetical protein